MHELCTFHFCLNAGCSFGSGFCFCDALGKSHTFWPMTTGVMMMVMMHTITRGWPTIADRVHGHRSSTGPAINDVTGGTLYRWMSGPSQQINQVDSYAHGRPLALCLIYIQHTVPISVMTLWWWCFDEVYVRMMLMMATDVVGFANMSKQLILIT